LGNHTVGFLNDIATGGNASVVGGNAEQAGLIVGAAIQQVSLLAGPSGRIREEHP
jgi:hypothetical protein